jgi:NADPH-dependent curcumin reductase CurA
MSLARAKPHARFVMCGAISQYNSSQVKGPRNILQVISMRIRMEGFIVSDHDECIPGAREEMARWIAEGKMKKSETILRGGLEAAEQGLIDLYKGINTGKLLVDVKDPNAAGGAKL